MLPQQHHTAGSSKDQSKKVPVGPTAGRSAKTSVLGIPSRVFSRVGRGLRLHKTTLATEHTTFGLPAESDQSPLLQPGVSSASLSEATGRAFVTISSSLPKYDQATSTCSRLIQAPGQKNPFTEQDYLDLRRDCEDQGRELQRSLDTQLKLSLALTASKHQSRKAIAELQEKYQREVHDLQKKLDIQQLRNQQNGREYAALQELASQTRNQAAAFDGQVVELRQQAATDDFILAAEPQGQEAWMAKVQDHQLIRSAFRMRLRDVHVDKETKLKREGCLPSSLIRNRALTTMLNNYPKDGFVPC
ncbi:hypothetical protein WJX84_003673 [Apatococcus fuscideae]|uniref:Uncharacterized protein n=1 Tax=Apatococcus fuscideae TaxID=2026836 RepID=A0AAW1SKP9_9CHLO